MASSKSFISHITELLAALDPVSIKPMFGIHGVFHQGLMFGIIAKDVLYLKTDEINRPSYINLGLEPFIYAMKDKVIVIEYYQTPADAMEDPDEMRVWAEAAYASAMRSKKS